MAKITPDPLASQYAVIEAINANFEEMADELNDKVLYRDNPVGEPNQMMNDLDMNSNNVLNASLVSAETMAIGGILVVAEDLQVTDLPSVAGQNGKFLTNDGVVPFWGEVEFPAADSIDYTPAGTGATTSSVAAKLNQTISVKDFGAVGDGAADDTAAVQAAIDHAESLAAAMSVGGVAVYFPGGEYKITSGLSVVEDNVVLEGDGARSSSLVVSTAFTVVAVSDCIGFGMRNLGIRATTGANLGSGVMLSLTNVSNPRLSNLDLRGWYDGIDLVGVTRGWFENIAGSQAGRTSGVGNDFLTIRGTVAAGGASGNHFSQIEVWNSSAVADPAYSSAVRTTSSDGLYIQQSHFVSGAYGLRIMPTGLTNNDTMASVLISDCYFDTVSINNVSLSGTASAYRDIRFVNCLMRASGGIGMVVSPESTAILMGLQVVGNQIRSSGTSGLSLGTEYIEGAIISNNVFGQLNTTSNASGHDLTIRGDSVVATGNIFLDGDATNGNCINITSSARRFIIKDNDMTGSTRSTRVANGASAANRYILGPNSEQTAWAIINETNTLQSTDATIAAIWTYTMEEESVLSVSADVLGLRSTAGSGTNVKIGASFFRNGAAAPTQIGTDTLFVNQESSASYAVSSNISGNNVRIMVTGLAGGNDLWIADVKAMARKL